MSRLLTRLFDGPCALRAARRFFLSVCACAGGESLVLSHLNQTDDELFDKIVAIDRGEKVEGVTKGQLANIDEPAQAAAATA